MSNAEKAKELIAGKFHLHEEGERTSNRIIDILDKANLLRQDGEMERIKGRCKECSFFKKHLSDTIIGCCGCDCWVTLVGGNDYCCKFEPTASKKEEEKLVGTPKSKCCGADVDLERQHDNTNLDVCSKCGKPCEVQEAKTDEQSSQPQDLNDSEHNTGREISSGASEKPIEPPVCPSCGHTDARWIKADGGFWLCNNCGCNITYVLKRSKEGGG